MRNCPKCKHSESYETARGRLRCKSCRHDFTTTSRTALSYRKMPLEKYEMACEAFRAGKTTAAVSKLIGCNYKTAWRLRKIAIKLFQDGKRGYSPIQA